MKRLFLTILILLSFTRDGQENFDRDAFLRGMAVSILEEGKEAIEAGNYREAIEILDRLDIEGSSNFHFVKAVAYYYNGNYAMAWDEFELAHSLGLDEKILSKVFSTQAHISHYWGEYDDAVNYATRAILADKKNAKAYALRARVKVQYGQYEEALYDLAKVVENSTDPTFSLYRGTIRLNVKDYRGAIKDIGRAYFRGLVPGDVNFAGIIDPFKEEDIFFRSENNPERDLHGLIRNFAMGRLERAERGLVRVFKQPPNAEWGPTFSLLKAHLKIARKKHPIRESACGKWFRKLFSQKSDV